MRSIRGDARLERLARTPLANRQRSKKPRPEAISGAADVVQGAAVGQNATCSTLVVSRVSLLSFIEARALARA